MDYRRNSEFSNQTIGYQTESRAVPVRPISFSCLFVMFMSQIIYRSLRDGRSIRTVSALLLQLVQTSAHDVRLEAKRIDKARQNKFALKRQESISDSQANLAPSGPFLDESDLEVWHLLSLKLSTGKSNFLQELRLYGSGLDSATKAAKTIILFLTQRSVFLLS